MYKTYQTLYQQCDSRYPASNAKFLPPNVQQAIIYPSQPAPSVVPKEAQQKTCGLGPSCSAGTCSTSPQWTKNPSLWGPHLWSYLHYSASQYPDKPTKSQKKRMKQWLWTLGVTIPCSQCSHHYTQHIKKHKMNLDSICNSKANLFTFLVDTHNKVNERSGKNAMTYQKAIEEYHHR